MKIFLDSADIDEIEHFARWGIVDGVTTTPTFFRRLGISDARAAAGRIASTIAPGELHVEALGDSADEIVDAALRNRELGDNVVSKIPIDAAGIAATVRLRRQHIAVNLHLVFSVNQALLAARAGARYICPLLGRMCDAGLEPSDVLGDIVAAITRQPALARSTTVMASSLRDARAARLAILCGAGALTVGGAVLTQMLHSPLTERAHQQLREDAAASGRLRLATEKDAC